VALIEQENQELKKLQSHITLQIPYAFHGYTLISAERANLSLPQHIASLKPLAEF
jgi:hypothetical protein